jgi:hypothetical protein
VNAWHSLKRQCEAAGPHAPRPTFAGLIGGGLIVTLVFIIIAGAQLVFGGSL